MTKPARHDACGGRRQLPLQLPCAIAMLALALSIPGRVRADARSAGLAGSLLIENRDDVYFFPQRTLAYPNQIAFSYGASQNAGNGLLLMGSDSFQFGVSVNRGDVLSPMMIHGLTGATGPASLFSVDELANLNGPTSVFGAPFGVTPATVVDLLFGTRAGGGDLGFRVGIGSGATNTTTAGMDTGQSDTFLMGEVGYGWGTRGQTSRFDLSGALALDFAGQQAAGTDVSSGTHFGVSGLMRGFIPMDPALDLGVLVNAQVADTSVTNKTATGEPAANTLAINVGGGVGPAFRFGRVQVAGYALVRAQVQNVDPNSNANNDTVTTHTIVLPGVHMAVEVPVTDWFFVRTGAEYAFNIRGEDAPSNNGTSARDGTFGWNAGLGVWIDQFRFDGSLQQGFVTGGPNFIGGGSGFLAIATLSYSFDKARKEALEVHAPPPAPPAPLPPPPPGPVAPDPAPAPEPAAATGGGLNAAANGAVDGSAAIDTQPAPADPAPEPAPAPSRHHHH